MKNRLQCWFVCVILCLTVTASGQVSTGRPPLGSFSSGPDVINLGNLNVNFSVPVFNKPGRGTPFFYNLTNDSSIWSPTSTSGTASWTPVANWGWRGQTDAAVGYVNLSIQGSTCRADDGTTQHYTVYLFNTYVDEFGTTHIIQGRTDTKDQAGCISGTGTEQTTATDASGLTFVLTNSPDATVIGRDGSTFHPPLAIGSFSGTITDRNGNQITTTSGATFVDTLGMTALSVSGTSPKTFTYTDSSGTARSVTINYGTYTVQTSFGCGGISEYGPTSASLVSNVTLPDGSSYSLQYEATPGVPAHVTGRIKSITLRTGGTITYVYTGGNNGITCADGSTSGLSRTTSDGTTDYSRSGSGTAWTTTILDAATPRNQTVINFQTAGTPANFYETHRKVNQGPSTTLLQTDICYNSAVEPNCSATAVTLPITAIKRYVILPNGNQSLNATTYNSFGLTTEVDEYDFGAAPSGVLLRESFIAYASLGNGIVDLPASTIIQNGSGTLRASQTFGYDETAVTTTSGVPQHAAVTGSRGNQTTLTDWVSATAAALITRFTYDDTGNILTFTDPGNNSTAFDYTDNFSEGAPTGTRAYPTMITLPSTGSPAVPHITHTQYEANTGLPATTTDLNGNQTTYTYDLMLRPLFVNAPDSGQTSFSYPSAASVISNQLITATQTASVTTTVDGYGRVKQQLLTSDPTGTDTVDTGYDTNGRVSSVSNPHRTDSNPTDGTTSYLYDALGRVTQQTQPDTNTIQAVYGNNCATLTDEAGKQRKNCVDALGRTVSAFEPDSTNTLNWETDNVFDPLNNIVTVTQKGGSTVSTQWRTRTFAFDGLSRLTQAVAPESGTTNYFYTTSAGSLCAGEPTVQCRIIDSRGITRTLAYDALSRLTGKTYSDTTPAVTYSYDQTTSNGLTVTFGNGLRTGMSDGSGATAWSYDKMGRVATRQQTISTVTKSIGYTYNLDSSIAATTYPSGRVYTYAYNNAGQIASLIDTVHNIKFFSNPQYAPPGLLTTGIHGAVTGWNAITLTNTYNNRLQPTQFQAVSPVPLTLLNLSYGYDQGSGKSNDSVVQITNGRDSTRTAAYTYDQVNRLATAQTPTAATWGDSYGYDAWGNLLQKTVIKGTAENMSAIVNTNNQFTTPAFTYDAAGNVTYDTSIHMTYDAEGHMNPTTGTTYTYDGDGRRVAKSDGTVYWIDDNLNSIAVGTSSGSITRDYVFLGNKRIAFVPISTGNPYYYLSDNLGSAAVVASGDGKTIQWEADYFPFGAVRQVFANTASNNYEFTGYEYDSDTQYNYAKARFEAGRWGRFMSPDPYLGSIDITNPQSLNRYGYVNNNPMNAIDPIGLVCSANVGNTSDSVCNPANFGGGGGSGGLVFGSASEFFWWAISQGPQVPFIVDWITSNQDGPGIPVIDFGPNLLGLGLFTDPFGPGGGPALITCKGVGRGLAGNARLNGKPGAIPGVKVRLGTAAVIPGQFGLADNGAALAQYARYISGTIGNANFSSVTDVVGGGRVKGFPNVKVREGLQLKYPGLLIIEIPGAKDQGVSGSPVTIMVPAGLGCPVGTGPAKGN
jgi:RHS repeat-associated protein